jgi:hypothetical protein
MRKAVGATCVDGSTRCDSPSTHVTGLDVPAFFPPAYPTRDVICFGLTRPIDFSTSTKSFCRPQKQPLPKYTLERSIRCMQANMQRRQHRVRCDGVWKFGSVDHSLVEGQGYTDATVSGSGYGRCVHRRSYLPSPSWQ